jgi:hypothetical protein
MNPDEIEELRCHTRLDPFTMEHAVKIATLDTPESRLISITRLLKELGELRDEVRQLRGGKKTR